MWPDLTPAPQKEGGRGRDGSDTAGLAPLSYQESHTLSNFLLDNFHKKRIDYLISFFRDRGSFQ